MYGWRKEVIIRNPKNYTATVVSHTHWDRAGSLPFQQSRIRLVKLVDELIQVLDDDPKYNSFIFDGQTIILEDYLEIRPEMERELKRLIQGGRILVGPWYVLPNEFLVSPEAIIRNLMIGHTIAESFGNVMKVGHATDSFGHITQLPQILQGFSMNSVIFMRGMGDEGEDLGSEFLWHAPDGRTKVLAVHQIGGSCNFAKLDFDSAMERFRSLIDMTKPYATTSNLLLNNGSDPADSQLELTSTIDYVNGKLDNVELVHGTSDDYLNRVKADNPKLKRYYGELKGGRYYTLPSGVFSTRMYIRQANESAQVLMERWAEPFSTLSWLETSNTYPRMFLWYAWKELIKNHLHNDICGCSVDEVHRDDMTRYEWVQQIGEELSREALESLARNIDTRHLAIQHPVFVVFNPLPWPRLDSVSISVPLVSIPANPVAKNALGEIVPVQIVHNQDGLAEVVFLGRVPALGYATYFLDSGEAVFEVKDIRPRTMENNFFRIKINPSGSLDILDKSTGSEYKGCNVYEDTEDAGDEYDYSPIKNSRTITSRAAKANVRIIENGAVRTTAEIRFSMNLPKGLTKDRTARSSARLSCPVVALVTIYSEIPRIDFITIFENKVEDHRLRVLFPTDIKTDSVHVEGHFDVLTRPLTPHKPKAEWAQNPLPTNHQNAFLDIDNGERGLAVINKGLPEYEVRKTKNGCTVYLTLLRCVGWLSRDDLLTRRGNAGMSMPTPEAQCPGVHTFRYSLFPHREDWVSAQAQRQAHEHNVITRVVLTDSHEGHLPILQSFISVEPHKLMVTALKKCELGNGIILRLYNSTAEMVNGIIKAHRPIKAACLTNLNEQPIAGGELGARNDGTVSLDVGGREIKTIELTF